MPLYPKNNPLPPIPLKTLLAPLERMGEGNSSKKRLLDKEEIEEYLGKGFIHGRAILEMAGAPKEYLTEKLTKYVNFLKQAGNVKLIQADIAKPKKNKGDKLFTIFAEIELLFKDATVLAFFCFDYMPSSIEIIRPEQFQYRGSDFASFFNDMLERIYRLDIVIKNLQAKNSIIETNMKLLLRNNVILSLRDKEKDVSQLSKNTGLPEKQLSAFLEEYVKENWLKKKNNKYAVNPEKVKVGKNV